MGDRFSTLLRLSLRLRIYICISIIMFRKECGVAVSQTEIPGLEILGSIL